jgi:hypothetical protein
VTEDLWTATARSVEGDCRALPPSRRRARWRRWTLVAAVAVAGVARIDGLPATAGEVDLGRLWCVDLVVGTFEAPSPLGVTSEAVHDVVEVALRDQAPRLRIQTTCPDALRILVVLAAASPTVFYGVADLTVMRRAIVVETGEFSRSEAWRTTFVLHGPAADAPAHLFRVLQVMVTRFAREHTADGDR